MTEATEPKCTCNDGEFVTAICPVHGNTATSPGYVKGVTMINDGHLLDATPINIVGYLFQCPQCKTPSIIVTTSYMPRHCNECGSAVTIQSRVFTDAIRKAQMP